MKQQTQIKLINWNQESLKKVLFTLESGGRPKGGAQKEGVPSIGGEHLNNNGKFNFEKMKFIPKDYFDSMNRGVIQKEDVLIVKDGATTGKTSFVENDFPYEKSAVNEHVFIARANDKLISKYLFYFLYSGEGQQQLKKSITGSAQGGINLSILDHIYVRYPISKKEQILIVQEIEKQFTRLDASVKSLKSVKKKLEIYRKAVLKKAFEKKEGWEELNFSKCFKSIAPTNKIKKSTYLEEGSLPVVDQGEELIGGYINDETKKQKTSLPIIIFGDHTRRFKFINFNFVAGADGIKILNSNEALNPKFAYYQCLTLSFPNKGYSRHFQYVQKTNLTFPTSIPEQTQIVQEIESKFSVIDKIEQVVEASLTKAEKLRKSILKSAFEGKLVKMEEVEE